MAKVVITPSARMGQADAAEYRLDLQPVEFQGCVAKVYQVSVASDAVASTIKFPFDGWESVRAVYVQNNGTVAETLIVSPVIPGAGGETATITLAAGKCWLIPDCDDDGTGFFLYIVAGAGSTNVDALVVVIGKESA